MENDPRFTADDRSLIFQRDGNAYVVDLATGDLRQLTDIRNGPAPRDADRATGMRGALERQQLELFDVIRDKQRTDSIQRAQRNVASRGHSHRVLPAGERLARSVSSVAALCRADHGIGSGRFGPGGGGGGGRGGIGAVGGAPVAPVVRPLAVALSPATPTCPTT